MRTKNTAFLACWKRGVPLVSIETADPAVTIRNCIFSLNGKGNDYPLLEWDMVSGLRGTNLPGQKAELGNMAAAEIASPGEPQMVTNPVEMFDQFTRKAPQDSILFVHGAGRMLDQAPVAQAVWNARDACKGKHRLIVLLGPSVRLPDEISHDVLPLAEDLPGRDELAEILDSVMGDAGLDPKTLTDEQRKRAVDSLTGLSAFEAEQNIAICLTPTGLDFEGLWKRKTKAIEATDGLTVYQGKANAMGGLQNGQAIMRATMRGKLGCSCLVLVDEIDKGLAASGTDTSGTTQDQNKVLLSYMQDNDITGMLWLGPPGTGKTQLAKTMSAEFGVPLILLDLGAMKGSLVGQSEQKMRAAIKRIHAISGGKPLFIGACNRTETLPPELRRRFNYCSLFFDLPSATERAEIWQVWIKSYGLTAEQCDQVNDIGWTGAEIRNCAMKSWAMDCTLSEAAKTIVPISKSAGDIVDGLRKSASGKYISAGNPGLYQFNPDQTLPVVSNPGRKMEL